MTMSSGPAAGALAGREDLTAARGFAGALAFVSGFGRVTALGRAAAGFLGDAAAPSAAFPVLASAPAAALRLGAVDGARRTGGFAGFPGTVESAPASGFADFRGGFGDGSDPDGVERFFAIYLSGA